MRNVHLITKQQEESVDILFQYLYITSEEAIKEGDWYLIEFNGLKIAQCTSRQELISIEGRNDCKKIILTTDPDLIAQGVQAIDGEFLEWFVKNPSCEFVEVMFACRGCNGVIPNLNPIGEYKIIIPQEEPKQETLEEQDKKLYSEEEVIKLLQQYRYDLSSGKTSNIGDTTGLWFEQFKKK